MTKEPNSEVSKEQIDAWKKKYGGVYELTFQEKKCYIRDPLFDLSVMKQAMTAMRSSFYSFVECILNNCFLSGDEDIRKEEDYINGLSDDVDEIATIPDATITEVAQGFLIKVNDLAVEFKPASRGDIKNAEKRNTGFKPLVTEEYLLKSCILNKEDMEKIKAHTPTYLGFLTAAEKLKKKKYAAIKKL